MLAVAVAESLAIAGRSCSSVAGRLWKVARRLFCWVAVAVAVRLAISMKRLMLVELLASAVMTVLESRVRFCSVVESLASRLRTRSV